MGRVPLAIYSYKAGILDESTALPILHKPQFSSDVSTSSPLTNEELLLASPSPTPDADRHESCTTTPSSI